jgi:hypothetical protein
MGDFGSTGSGIFFIHPPAHLPESVSVNAIPVLCCFSSLLGTIDRYPGPLDLASKIVYLVQKYCKYVRLRRLASLMYRNLCIHTLCLQM